MDTGKVSVLTLLDLSAAFDTVNDDNKNEQLLHGSGGIFQSVSIDSVYRWETILASYHSL